MMSEKTCTVLVRQRAARPYPDLDEHVPQLPCEHCGKFGYLERHHRQFRSRGGLWIPSNVILICSSCHLSATDEAPWVQGCGLNVHSFEEPSLVPVDLWHAGAVLLDDCGTFTPSLFHA